MILTRLALLPAVFALGACASEPPAPQFRAYDLELTHPSPTSTYLMVAPGAFDADLPRPRQIKSRKFSRYLREATGCGVDTSIPASPVGDKRMPAGYMVPVLCP